LPPPVTAPVVPYIETVHDHGALEIQRGCSRGCRFCQATTIYRPVRERPHDEVVEAGGAIIRNCGHSELSLVSLSSGDYPDIGRLIQRLLEKYQDRHIRLSLPSLRLDASSVELVDMLPSKRKMTLTFAPEAGTERLRAVINKATSDATILDTMAAASQKGGASIKLYFMVGLPTETDDDIKGIATLVEKICGIHRQYGGKPLRVKVSLATLVPKPHTACQWMGQETQKVVVHRIGLLRQKLRHTGVQFSWHDPQASQLEAALSRGDRRVGDVILEAWRSGCKFDAWREHFDYQRWADAFARHGLSMEFFANRPRPDDEIFPWAHIDTGISPGFLKREKERVLRAEGTPDCRREACNSCGLQRWMAACREKHQSSPGRNC
ncbi:MAG: radical SAM protein, partial [Dehalococcoidia bacterium]|nr:radical SAM protein [Dehalococcoidia bacterium]